MQRTILRGHTSTGDIWFYSGRAGNTWVSQSRADSFVYDSMNAARRKAKLFNAREPMTGLRFVAIPLTTNCPFCGAKANERHDSMCGLHEDEIINPFCECDLPGPDEEEQMSNTCKACGKRLT